MPGRRCGAANQVACWLELHRSQIAAVCMVVAHVGEEDRCGAYLFQELHGEGGVHIRLGGADVGLFGAVPVVGVVEESFCNVHGAEVIGQLWLSLDTGEVQIPFLDQLPHHVVGSDLPFDAARRMTVRRRSAPAGVSSSHSRQRGLRPSTPLDAGQIPLILPPRPR